MNLFEFFEPEKRVEDIEPAPEVVLRPYQQEAVDAVFYHWHNEGHDATLVCLPTGCRRKLEGK